MSEFGTNDASHELIPLYMYALTLPTNSPESGFAVPPRGSNLVRDPLCLGKAKLCLRLAGLFAPPPRGLGEFRKLYHTPIFLDISKTPE